MHLSILAGDEHLDSKLALLLLPALLAHEKATQFLASIHAAAHLKKSRVVFRAMGPDIKG
jgi:hypothetical protein